MLACQQTPESAWTSTNENAGRGHYPQELEKRDPGDAIKQSHNFFDFTPLKLRHLEKLKEGKPTLCPSVPSQM